MKRLFSFFLLLILSAFSAFGQVPPENPATGAAGVTPVVPGSEAVSSLAVNATFKYGILESMSGKIGFYVQADFGPNASMELGLGVTRKNILTEAATGSGDNNGYFLSTFNSPYWQGANKKDLEEFFYDYDFRTVKTGTYVSLMPRLSFSSPMSAMSRFFGCRFEYRRYNWKADGVFPTNELIYNPNIHFTEMERQLNLMFIYGGFFKMGNLSLEFYAGAGTRYYYMKKRDIGIEYKGALQVPEYGAVLSTFKKTSAMVEVGINFGISTSTK